MVKLKNHVTPKAKRINQVIKQKFGVTLDDFTAAMQGDVTSAQKIGELARQGRLSAELAPQLAAAYHEIINGTTAQNKAFSEVLVNAGKSAIEIDKAVMNATLANTQYAHRRSELASEFINARNAENQRHNYQMNYQQIKGYIDVYLAGIDNKTSLLEQSYRPELKQIQSDEQYQTKVLNHVLDKGDNSRVDLIPEKQYLTNGIKETFLKVKSALGF
ncbi:hypothetical protein FNW02_28800 [Komarekiella sp. 'clone 1']|uniref:Uncharacterized protein n=1 Tax=Komarekiella delphini-convector SJRDD-AB1 TaxID=2593771 RepID=A0AA40VU06_9NOST|nr:hypothetical protein [Komarekiella delphini-convector]MBD6619709.1 hypothetical protein [Komarekiella delphini-convector SJRDD-AB1]